jgi:hypothetical protein
LRRAARRGRGPARRTGDAFSVEVRDDERALDVFHHPYAYAATRRAPRVALAA